VYRREKGIKGHITQDMCLSSILYATCPAHLLLDVTTLIIFIEEHILCSSRFRKLLRNTIHFILFGVSNRVPNQTKRKVKISKSII
jgi:hypothetical protein